MFADCPSCGREFRIHAWQLRAADGWVRCGHCGASFVALERLHDAPTGRARAGGRPGAGAIPELRMEDSPEEEAVSAAPRIDLDDAGTAREENKPGGPSITLPEDDDPFPDFPAQTGFEQPASGGFGRVMWAGIVLVLLAVTLLQIAWFNRDPLLRAYPPLIPWAEQACERFQCDLFRFRDLSAIRLLNREVRLHPRYRDALLVTATLVNQAEFVQSWPEIQLVVFDTRARVISHRNFRPADYLGSDVNITAGMSPGIPVHFSLELAGTTQQAVSFEFRFR